MQLETKRLLLRPWQESDAESLYKYASDLEVGPPAGWPAHTSVENSRQIIRTVLSAPETYAVCLKENGVAVGSIGLKTGENTDMTDRTDECELGYWIGKPFWGQGLIPEAAEELLRHAFEDLKMRAVWCGYYDGNVKSRRVQEKLGFTYHHTTENLEVPLLCETRTGHVMLLTKETWSDTKVRKQMERSRFFKSVIDQDTAPIVICDLEHTIAYMNPASVARYHADLTGKSIKSCHPAAANEKIDRVVAWFAENRDNNVVYTYHSEKENKDVYMIALRDDHGTLIGYYEKHEYRNKETKDLYQMP